MKTKTVKSIESNRVTIFDTTLRDGEQSPGASMNQREKLELAHQLADLNVDVIEAGFPIASPDDFEAVKAVALAVKGPVIAGLARCVKQDIERCADAVCHARKSRIHVFLATSAIHRRYKLRKACSEILKMAVDGIRYARRFCRDVEFSPEDASRTEPDFLAQIVEAAIDAGASTINIPDTVGYAIPSEFGRLIGSLYETVPNISRATISVHCHNDLGLAVANSLAAIQNGSRAIECTINGLGERAGNAALEEIVMVLKTRPESFQGAWTAIKTEKLYKVSRLVSRLTGMSVQRNKAIVGANAFAHEAGVHQDGVLKKRTTYEIMRPEDIGIEGSDLVLGKHSGRHAFQHHLQRLGIQLSAREMEGAYQRFIALADKKKKIYDDDLFMIVREGMADSTRIYRLDYLNVTAGTGTVPTATVRLCKGQQVLQDAACGDGPVDAALKTIDRMTGIHGHLLDFNLQAISADKDAQGEVSIRVQFGADIVSAKAASTDIVEASARAYLNCVNRLLTIREQARGARKPSVKARRA
ncbi:MAG: 2-isopropylmalate synthase [Lentisphaerae bacterium RIFOXYC12_FULL_60_16]|nr:MAG: 2-isopropylmalate synthase [Lentisphaerae bacterium RIFOXYC12_FULL_60_16]OGV86361.1 MAG: 2-isopropylmalate synthase [Lentisphaerae bacterium RIFOXYB12_FULL_60_10]